MRTGANSGFPGVLVQQAGGGMHTATVALRLESVLDPAIGSNPASSSFGEQVRFLRAFAACPASTLLLDVYTVPDLAFQRRGRLEVVLSLAVRKDSAKAALAEALSRHRVLVALLATHLPDFKFLPLDTPEEITSALEPFEVRHCVAIGRRRRTLSVAWEDDGGASGGGIGFLPVSVPGAGGESAPPDPAHLGVHYLYPWSPSTADIASVGEALLWYPAPVRLHVRMRPHVPRDVDFEPIAAGLRYCEELLARSHGAGGTLALQAAALRKVLTERLQALSAGLFLGGVFLSSTAPLDEAIVETVGQVISPVPLGGDEGELLRGGFHLDTVEPSVVRDMDVFPSAVPFSVLEAACALRIPRPLSPDCPGITIRSHRTRHAPAGTCGTRGGGAILLGHNEHQGYVQEIRMSPEDRMRHWFILGQTGTGKSTFVKSSVVQDIEAGRGVCLVDPHGDLVRDVLPQIPKGRWQDVVLLDLQDDEAAVPFNLLEWKTAEERDYFIDDMLQNLDQIYDLHLTGGPMFENYFRGMMRLLMGDRPRADFTPTLLDFPHLFQSKAFRTHCAAGVQDPQIHAFLRDVERVSGEASIQNISPYVTSKLSRFFFDTNLRRVVGQEGMALDFSAIMREGKILLVNLGKARYGELACAILAGQIVARFKAATLRRAKESPASRRDFFLYVDEFQNLASESFVTLFAEARKFRLGLVVANQYADQLGRRSFRGGGTVLDAILGNVGTTVCFRLGTKDAEALEPTFQPTFGRHDLANLPNWECYVRQNLGQEKPVSVSMRTLHEPGTPSTERTQALIELSRTKYAVPFSVADRLIEEKAERVARLL